MPSLFNEAHRTRLLERIDSMSPESQRQWGTMSVPKALCHMGDQLLTGLGDIEVRRVKSPVGWPPVRWFVIHWMPWPKGVKTAPELLKTDIEEVQEAKERLKGIIERCAQRGASGSWSPHPLFGNISGKAWGVLGAKHLDHHLRQFGA